MKVGVPTGGPERINEGLWPLVRPIDGLKHDPENARLHPERNLDAIKASLKRSGQQRPVVARADGTVIAGNGVLAAASAMGWGSLAVLVFDSDSAGEARAFALADNRTAELARWDHDRLGEVLASIRLDGLALDGLGWNGNELDGLLKPLDGDREPGDGDGPAPERKTIALTGDQFRVVMRAVANLRAREGDEEITDGRALELICADFMGGV